MGHDVSDPETLVPDLLDLRAFALVVELRSFTAAARRMGETKGTVSRRIARLEKALDIALVRRSPRFVEATEDGVAYRLRVARVLELMADANTSVRKARATPSGRLRVTAPADLANTILAAKIAAFGMRYPEVVVEMEIIDRILDFDVDQIDVALRATRSLPDSQLIAHKLLDLEAIAVASPAYLRQYGTPKRLEHLDQHRLIVSGLGRGKRVVSMQKAGGGPSFDVNVRPAVISSEFGFSKEVALADAGIAFVPSVIVTNELRRGKLVHVLPAYVLFGAALYLLHHGARFLPPKVRAFRDFMLDAFGVPKVRPRDFEA
jgi:DNA-binding transcriptional LysR family regulator